MEYESLQERYFESLEAVQGLLDLIGRRENEINALYARIEGLESELERRDKIIRVLEGGKGDARTKDKDTNAPDRIDGKGPMAVLVDPMPRMRLILKEIIIGAGFTVAGEARDIKTAVELTKHEKPDLVIINSKLGAESGLEALKKMREVIPGLKAILITDGPDPAAVISGMEQGVADIIPKPINRLRLHELAISLVGK